MAREKRLIDANELKKYKFPSIDSLYDDGWNDAIDAITENAPTVYAVEVVRCKDCKYFNGESCSNSQWWDDDYTTLVKEEDFCSYGERKKNG